MTTGISRGIVGLVVILTLVTCAFGGMVWSLSLDVDSYASYSRNLRNSLAADDDVNQQVARASTGSIPHYDGVDASLERLQTDVSLLRNIPAFLSPRIREEMERARMDFDDPENAESPLRLKLQRVERFKSQHARVRAVEFYFSAVAGDVAEKLRDKNTDLSRNIDVVIRELLAFNLNRDVHLGDRIDAELNDVEDFADRKDLAMYASDIHDIVRQARFIVTAQPHLDGLTERILEDRQLPEAVLRMNDAFERGYVQARESDQRRRSALVLLLFLDFFAVASVIIVTIRREHNRAETLLLNILPVSIANELKRHPNDIIAEDYADVTVLFADIVGFTPLASRMKPVELVAFLNRVFSAFDRLAAKHGLEKIKTLGDAYMVAGGLPERRTDHAEAIANMALDMQREILTFRNEAGEGFGMRIGINSGPVVAGVIGIKKFIYDLWGDAVNVASRMESHGVPNGIHCSTSTWERLKDRGYRFEDRGVIQVKGKGDMRTYLLLERPARVEEKQIARA